jgi:hypothetical protein
MRFNYANLLRNNDRKTDAIEEYKQVLRVAPPQQSWLEARYTLALNYSERGDKPKARETLAALRSLGKHLS